MKVKRKITENYWIHSRFAIKTGEEHDSDRIILYRRESAG